MERRAFLGHLALGAIATPGAVLAQPARRVFRIGVMSARLSASEIAGPEPRDPHAVALLRGLRELGYVYGEHFVTEPRGGEGRQERFAELATELVRLQVDVIVAGGPLLPALKSARSEIPVVMAGAADPVLDGFVQSLRRPGGNFTGLSLQLMEITGKRLELAQELAPTAGPVAVLWSRIDRSRPSQAWLAAEAAAKQRGWKLVSLEIQDSAEIEGAFRTAAAARRIPDRPPDRAPRPTGPANRQAGFEVSTPRRLRAPALRRVRRPDVLRGGFGRRLSARGRLRRQDPERRQACRFARRAADEVRAGDQSQGREIHRTGDPAVNPGASGRGHSVSPLMNPAAIHTGVELRAPAAQEPASIQ
jgi:hypothetical protein